MAVVIRLDRIIHLCSGLPIGLGNDIRLRIQVFHGMYSQYHETEDVMSKKMLGDIMREAQKLQAKMAEIQEEAKKKTVEATAGGGMVTVVASGAGEMVSIKIEKEVVNADDIEMLQDLIIAAANEALRRAQEMVQSEMSKLTGGLQLPGLGNLGKLF